MAKPAFDPTKPVEVIKPAFDPSQPFESVTEAEGPGVLEQAETAGRSFIEGVSGGLSEPVISSVNAVLGNLIDSGFDKEDLKDFFSKSIDAARISKEYERDVERRKTLEQELPKTALASEIAGAFAPFSAPAKIGKAAAGAVKGLAKIPAIGSIVAGGVEAAAGAAGQEALKQAAQIPTGFIEPGEAPSVGEVAESGGKIGAAIGALPVVGKAAGFVAPRVLSAFGSVSPSAITTYLKREAPIASVSSEKLAEAVSIAAKNVQDALKTQKSLTADDLVTAVQALKQKVIDSSAEAFDILENASQSGAAVSIPFSTVQNTISKSLSGLRAGAQALTPVRESAANYLEDILGRFQSRVIDGKIDLVTAKEMIQAIDEVKNYEKAAGSFSSSLDSALGALRRAIDEPLKQIPEYAAKMKEVSESASLLAQANDYFGEASKAFKNVDRLVIGRDPYILNAVNKLEKATGIPINRGIESLQNLKPVEDLKPDSVETFVKEVIGGRSKTAQNKLRIISQMSEEDLVDLGKRAELTKEFQKMNNNGSRDVNFWREILGSGVGVVSAGPVGALTGATIGYLNRTFGAPATKLILDGMLKVKGMPTVKKLNQALNDIPPEAKQNLIQGFIRANTLMLEKHKADEIAIEPGQISSVYNEVKTSNLDATTKALALDSLSKNSTINKMALARMTIGEQPKKSPVVMPRRKDALEEDRPRTLKNK